MIRLYKMEGKKILISTPYFLPNVSGITIYVDVLAKELVKRGHQVTILTSQHESNLPLVEIRDGVKIRRLPAPISIGKGRIMPSLLWQGIKEIQKAEIINCHLPEFESGWMCLWAKIFEKNIILTHHTDLSFWVGWKNKIIDSSVFVSQIISGMLADFLVPYTQDYADFSYYLRYFSKKLKPIYPPIKFKNSKNSVLDKRIKEIIKGKKYVIGFSGRIAKQKGLEVLIKATDVLNKKLGNGNYVILLAGPKTVIGETYYQELLTKYGDLSKKNMIFLDGIPRSDLATFYKNIDLLVLPSNDRLESFGWVQIEAMKCGVPVVATDLPGMRVPILETRFGYLFENNNSDDLADKIIKSLTERKKTLPKNWKGLSIFDYQKSIDEYEKLF